MKKVLFLIIFVIFNLSFAQSDLLPLVRCKGLDCTWNEFVATIQRGIRALLYIGYWITAVVCIVGAFLVMIGGYRKDLLNLGKKMMIDSLVYYVILLLAGVIFDLILDFISPKVFTGQ